ncbi:MAG: carotenoid oxygenase family protein [Pseudomonadota bacterium]
MNRREFMGAAAAAALMQAIPLAARAATSPPWSIGFEGLSDDLPPLDLKVSGAVPDACYGTLYRNGPTRFERGGRRYQHWFDPDGMIQAFTLDASGVSHKGRFVRTSKFLAEEEQGRFLRSGAGTYVPDSSPGRNNEDGNVANINVQELNGELLALWEAGSAYRVDPGTLETLGVKTWSKELEGVPFSAHPHFDENGDLWNIGSVPFAAKPMLVLYHVGADGVLRSARAHDLDFPGYMHDFVLTPRYLVALNSSAVLGHGDTFVDSMHWEGSRPSQLLVFDRNDFELVAQIDVPPTFVFHFGNGSQKGNLLEFAACAYPDMSIVSHGMRRLARQEYGDYHTEAELVRYRVDLKSAKAEVLPLDVNLEFPSYNTQQPFAPQSLLGSARLNPTESTFASAVARVDARSGELSSFDYGGGVIVEEPLFVPGPNGGYAVHSYLDFARKRTGIAVLAVDHLEDGPLMRAEMDRVLPLGFHGCFIKS